MELIANSKLIQANKKTAKAVVGGYRKIEDSVIDGSRKIAHTVVSWYQKVEDAFVGQFLTRGGESVEEAKAHLTHKQEQNQPHS